MRVGRHQHGCAWMEQGSRLLARGDRDGAIRCQRMALGILNARTGAMDPGTRADLASAWVNLGVALLATDERGATEEALSAFERALGHLDELSVDPCTRFQHNRAAALMNRGDALAKLGGNRRQEALAAYEQAIAAAEGLPLDERPAFRILLAACWINAGDVHQRLDGPHRALESWERAVDVLGSLPEAGHRAACHHAATAWINRGEALLGLSGTEAIAAAKRAWAVVDGCELDQAVSAKLRLRALRVMALGLEDGEGACPAPMPLDRVVALADLAEWGLEIAFEGRAGSPEVFDPFILWFFSLGCRTYGRHQPQFLGEFLSETRGRSEPALDRALAPLARGAVTRALERLGRSGRVVAGTPRTDRLLDIVQNLRNALPCPR